MLHRGPTSRRSIASEAISLYKHVANGDEVWPGHRGYRTVTVSW